MRSNIAKYGAVMITLVVLLGDAEAECPSCGGGSGGIWDGKSWIETALGGSSNDSATTNDSATSNDLVPSNDSTTSNDSATSNNSAASNDSAPSDGMNSESETGAEAGTEAAFYDDYDTSTWSVSAQEIKLRLDGDKKPLIAYVSNTAPQSSSYIEGSINLPSKSFVKNDDSGLGMLKSESEMAGVLGNAGVTEDDDLVIYGDCLSCGDPTFVFWIMQYLGHENVTILRGSSGDWAAAGIPTAGSTTTRPAATYTSHLRPELLADYDSVAAGEFVVVDARTPGQFAAGHIDGAVNIDFNRMIDGGWIKDDSALAGIFADLEADRPVAVYTKNGGQASIVWYALMLQGRDARLYTWNDWLRHQS